MFPVKMDEKSKLLPLATVLIIIVCTVVFLGKIIPSTGRGLIPLDFTYTFFHPQEGLSKALVMLITSFFLHGSILHLLGNMWYLWIFGAALEGNLGSVRYLLCFIIYGIVSMVFQVAFDPISTVPIVGASGAIAGIMGMYLVMKPFSKLVIWLPPIFFFSVPAFLYLVFWFWLQWMNMSKADVSGSMIAWWAHIGGFLAGVFSALWLKIIHKRKFSAKK